MSERPPVEHEAPPAGEHIHMPGPSILPLLNAVGLTVAIIGVTLSPVFVVAGGVLFLVTTVVWIRSVKRDVDELPLEHH